MLKQSLLISVTILAITVNCGWAATFAENVTGPVEDTLVVQQHSQRQADEWEAQRLVLVAELTALQQQQQQLEIKKTAQTLRVNSEQQAVEQLMRTIEESKRLAGEMTPFLTETYDLMAQQVEQDLPFLPQERQLRLSHLSEGLNDPQLAVGEKFRRVMEVLRVETEYGLDIEVAQQSLTINGRDLLMNQLRIGRLALFAQSLNGDKSVIYDKALQSWQPLDAQYNRELGRAIEMAQKHRPIDLLTLPLGKVVSR